MSSNHLQDMREEFKERPIGSTVVFVVSFLICFPIFFVGFIAFLIFLAGVILL